MSEGLCYGCRHADDAEHPTQHCRGTGDLEPSPEVRWEGFVCTCDCRVDR